MAEMSKDQAVGLMMDVADVWKDRYEKAAARIERLEEALRPFAALADEFGDEEPDTDRVYCKDNKGQAVIGFFLSNIRAARAALGGETP